MTKRVLFLCTGNYYRSRLAEELFNHKVDQLNLDWNASSRALAIERGKGNVGPISEYALKALLDRDIQPRASTRFPVGCTEIDLEQSDLIVAMKEAEHRPLIKEAFGKWETRVIYWHVHDLDVVDDFSETGKLVDALVTKLIEAMR